VCVCVCVSIRCVLSEWEKEKLGEREVNGKERESHINKCHTGECGCIALECECVSIQCVLSEWETKR